MIDILLILVFGGVTYCVAGEGAWGAAVTCISTILSGLLAMNFFEPICNSLMSSQSGWQARLDVIVLVGLFAGGVSLMRFGVDYLSPTYIAVHRMVFEGARWGCAALTGYVTMAFLLTALHTSSLPREFAGFRPERMNLFDTVAPDRQWLGFTQWVTERVCDSSPARVFDGPRVVLGEPGSQPQILPSFPIRYATRRGRGMTATASGPPPAVRQVPAQKKGAPSQGF